MNPLRKLWKRFTTNDPSEGLEWPPPPDRCGSEVQPETPWPRIATEKTAGSAVDRLFVPSSDQPASPTNPLDTPDPPRRPTREIPTPPKGTVVAVDLKPTQAQVVAAVQKIYGCNAAFILEKPIVRRLVDSTWQAAVESTLLSLSQHPKEPTMPESKPTPDPPKPKIGDVFALASGGPRMTVMMVERGRIHVAWFAGTELRQDILPIEAHSLDLAEVAG